MTSRIRMRCRGQGHTVMGHRNYALPIIDVVVRRDPDSRSHPARFLVDTGASLSVLNDPLLATQLGLNEATRRGAQTIVGVSGSPLRCDVHQVELGLISYWFPVLVAVSPEPSLNTSLLGHFNGLDLFKALNMYRTGNRGPVEVVSHL